MTRSLPFGITSKLRSSTSGALSQQCAQADYAALEIHPARLRGIFYTRPVSCDYSTARLQCDFNGDAKALMPPNVLSSSLAVEASTVQQSSDIYCTTVMQERTGFLSRRTLLCSI